MNNLLEDLEARLDKAENTMSEQYYEIKELKERLSECERKLEITHKGLSRALFASLGASVLKGWDK